MWAHVFAPARKELCLKKYPGCNFPAKGEILSLIVDLAFPDAIKNRLKAFGGHGQQGKNFPDFNVKWANQGYKWTQVLDKNFSLQ
jgi:hypothetical protein